MIVDAGYPDGFKLEIAFTPAATRVPTATSPP